MTLILTLALLVWGGSLTPPAFSALGPCVVAAIDLAVTQDYTSNTRCLGEEDSPVVAFILEAL